MPVKKKATVRKRTTNPVLVFAKKHGFEVDYYRDDEYMVSCKTGYNMGDGSHTHMCYSLGDVRDTVDIYRRLMTKCRPDCDCTL